LIVINEYQQNTGFHLTLLSLNPVYNSS